MQSFFSNIFRSIAKSLRRTGRMSWTILAYFASLGIFVTSGMQELEVTEMLVKFYLTQFGSKSVSLQKLI